MSVTHPVDPAPVASVSVTDELALPPKPRGWAALQANLVDRIKRAAIRHLHASARGERLLLRLYLDGEEASQAILREQLTSAANGPMTRQIRQHLAEEDAHTALFAAALGARGCCPSLPPGPQGLSRRKLARWRQLANRHALSFSQGSLVLAYATALCAEQMAVRIMRRHCETIGPQHALYGLFSTVLADEHRHVRLCAHTLRRLVAPREMECLAIVLAEVRKIETAFGVSSAIAMYAAGLVSRALPEAGAR